MKKFLILIGLASRLGAQSPSTAPEAGMDSLLFRNPGRPGVHLSGRSLSQFMRSSISGMSADAETPTGENQAFSRADLAVTARPGADAGGKAIIRVHQDWNRYYEEGPNPLVIRWLDFSGSALDSSLSYAVGDLRARFSPLTLSAQEPEILMEPGIFAARRRRAMQEWFLGDGAVPLQGIRAGYAHAHPAWLGLSADLVAARLRRADPDGGFAWRFQTDDVDRWTGAGSAGLRLMEGLELGLTRLRVFDPVSIARARNLARLQADQGATPATLYETNDVTAPRLGLDAAPLLRDSRFSFRIEGEYAFSDYRAERDSLAGEELITRSVEALSGRALQAVLKAGYGRPDDAFAFSADLGWLQVDRGFVNDLAQSPVFMGRRILNSRNAVSGSSRGYSTLDALYNHAYDIRPVTNLNTLEGWGSGSSRPYTGTNNWLRSAAFKNSYSSSVSTRAEREALKGSLDPHIQLLYPYGRATPNRKGFDGKASASFLRGALQARAVIARLQEIEGEAPATMPGDSATADTARAPRATFARNGAGLSLDLATLIPRLPPISLSLGMTADSRGAYRASLLSAGISARPRDWLALSGGYQRMESTAAGTRPGLIQGHWALGAEAEVVRGAAISLEGGYLDLRETGAVPGGFTQFVTGAFLRIGF